MIACVDNVIKGAEAFEAVEVEESPQEEEADFFAILGVGTQERLYSGRVTMLHTGITKAGIAI